ncbi:hypothetical protein Raf01_71150 [Rugosimonospora africana]|uniref:Uncharacterized protein n=1 Tax=Rugosimonospora africana TaxID=556532 RepID=A0A8J3VUR6_9ACTN|nr:hypothetical protein Raf01_71150 [Rugosimonospora africana]
MSYGQTLGVRPLSPGPASRHREPIRPGGGGTVNPDANQGRTDVEARTQETRYPNGRPAANQA